MNRGDLVTRIKLYDFCRKDDRLPWVGERYGHGQKYIYWNMDPSELVYLRAHTVITSKRWSDIRGPIANGIVVGYECLGYNDLSISPMAFERIVYTVRDYDRWNDPNGNYSKCMPCEAVLVDDLLQDWQKVGGK